MGKSGFVLTYTSYKSLDADFDAYMTHGAMVVSCDEASAPKPETPAIVRVVSPSGEAFDIDAKAAQFIKARGGVMMVFDGGPGESALEGHVKGAGFQNAATRESEDAKSRPKVTTFDAGLASSAPRKAPLAEDLADPAPQPARRPPPATESDTKLRTTARPMVTRTAATTTARSGPSAPAPARAEDVITTIRRPEPGETYPLYVLKYMTVRRYVADLVSFENEQLYEIAFDGAPDVPDTPAKLRLTLPGHAQYEVFGVVERVGANAVVLRFDPNDEAYRRAVIHPQTVSSKARLAKEVDADLEPPKVTRLEETMPDEDPEKMPIRRRLARMGMDDKINLALSGDREERMALAMDSNKAVHHYLLKNARITLDEIAFIARLPSLNPDVLDRIAEIPAYTQNPSIAKALVYNPCTPVLTAIKLLDRLPRPEIMNLAKRTNMNMRLVMAAKKKLEKQKA